MESSDMPPDVQLLKDEYRQLVREYIDAVHEEEMSRLEALPSPNSGVIQEWLDACGRAEAINQRRVEAQLRLRDVLTGRA